MAAMDLYEQVTFTFISAANTQNLPDLLMLSSDLLLHNVIVTAVFPSRTY